MPLRLDAMRQTIASYVKWYAEHRPHTALGGRTPLEVYRGLAPANEAPRFEPRARWPRRSACAKPVAPVQGRCGMQLGLGARPSVRGRLRQLSRRCISARTSSPQSDAVARQRGQNRLSRPEIPPKCPAGSRWTRTPGAGCQTRSDRSVHVLCPYALGAAVRPLAGRRTQMAQIGVPYLGETT